jgi:hypothetical protein
LRDMQRVIVYEPAIAYAVHCLPLYDQLELTLELLQQDDWPQLERCRTTPAQCRPLPPKAGDTLCIGQVESLGIRLLLRRARELRNQHEAGHNVLERLEDLAQLLALWRPGAWGKQREQTYLDARFAGVRPSYIHPSMAQMLASTHGQLLYVDQLLYRVARIPLTVQTLPELFRNRYSSGNVARWAYSSGSCPASGCQSATHPRAC